MQAADDRFSQAMQLDPNLKLDPTAEAQQAYAAGRVDQAAEFVLQGEFEKAMAAVREAQKLDPTIEMDVYTWYNLCSNGSLNGYAATVLDACDEAVKLLPDNGFVRNVLGSNSLSAAKPG
jgi:tetratricopeptide (TPR) repeat protein